MLISVWAKFWSMQLNMKSKHITLAHGNGGRLTNELIHEIFLKYFDNPFLRSLSDATEVPFSGRLVVTTDGYIVDPIFFPGGDIGKLAVCGTINDLAVSGALPKYLTCNFFIEEGFSIENLKQICQGMANTAKENDVLIVAGDTKVLPKGESSGISIATTGIGEAQPHSLGISKVKTGDLIYVTGSIGDHGAAVLLAREKFGLSGDVKSDCASVLQPSQKLLTNPHLKFMRDPTRGGLATVCHEIIELTRLGINLYQDQLPIQKSVSTFCEILGFDPLYLACEGRIVFIIDPQGEKLLNSLDFNLHHIGEIDANHDQLLLNTHIGGKKLLPVLEHDALPRIC